MLANQHPDLVLDGCMEEALDDTAYAVSVEHGCRRAVAGPGPPQGVPKLRLTINRAGAKEERAMVSVDLNRTGVYAVPQSGASRLSKRDPGKVLRLSTLTTPAVVVVELQKRVAIVSVSPGLGKLSEVGDDGEATETAEENERTINCGIRVELLSIALVTEGSAASSATATSGGALVPATAAGGARLRNEAFTVTLADVRMSISQTPDRRRNVGFRIRDAQVDLQHPGQDVVLWNATQPFLEVHVSQDDVCMLDVHLRQVELKLGELEVSVTGAAWEQVRLLMRNFVPGATGLVFEEVLDRASVPYHLGPVQPPQASSKLVVSQLNIGHAKVHVWCRLYLPEAHYLPKTLRDTIQVVSLGTNRLEVKGASVKLPQQLLFSARTPMEGSLGAVLAHVSENYMPHVKACWRSLLQHSNIFLGGLLSRHTWAPRQRKAFKPVPPLCGVGPSGEICLDGTSQTLGTLREFTGSHTI